MKKAIIFLGILSVIIGFAPKIESKVENSLSSRYSETATSKIAGVLPHEFSQRITPYMVTGFLPQYTALK